MLPYVLEDIIKPLFIYGLLPLQCLDESQNMIFFHTTSSRIFPLILLEVSTFKLFTYTFILIIRQWE